MACLTEDTLAKCKHLGWPDHKDECRDAFSMMKSAIAHLVLPLSIPFRGPRPGETLESVIIVRDLDGVAFNHDVDSLVPLVAAGEQDDVWVVFQVDGLLIGCAGAKMDSAVKPNRNKRRYVRSAIGQHRTDPEHLRRFEYVTGRFPVRDNALGSLNRESSVVIGSFIKPPVG